MKMNLINLCLSIFFVAILFLGCEEKISLDELSTDSLIDSSTAIRTLENAKIQLTNAEYVTANIIAGRIDDYGRSLIYADKGIKVHFLDEKGDTVSTLTSKRARIFPSSNYDMEAIDDVVVITRDSIKLYTELLQWDNHEGIIHTDDTVRIVRGKDYLRGRSFRATANLKKYTIKKVYATTVQNIGKIFQ